MANYFNIFGGTLAFLASSSIIFALWNPVLNFLSFFPTDLYVLVGVFWLAICFTMVVYMPFIIMVSDDKGA